MHEIYWALAQRSTDSGEPVLLTPEAVERPSVAAQTMGTLEAKSRFWGIGAGWHYPELQALGPAGIEEAVYPHAEDIARLAVQPFLNGEAQPADRAQPVYLRDTVTWKKRQRIRS